MRLTVEDAQRASDEWGFNCGPGALCALLDMTPDELRPHLLGFEDKGYTNPTLMASILRGLGVPFSRVWEWSAQEPPPADVRNYPGRGLIRVQWAGPWTKPGVPMRVRYRHSHWIASRLSTMDEYEFFDVNAIGWGGWMHWYEWKTKMVPWILKACVPKADGRWWPTHCWKTEGIGDATR